MAQQPRAGRDRAVALRGRPVGSGGRRVYLAADEVHDAIEDGLLVGHVVVERHHLEPEASGQVAHAQRVDALVVGEFHASRDDAVAL